MTACQCCGSESKRIQLFHLDYQRSASVDICPNCFTECLANAKALRALIGQISFLLARDGITVEDSSAEEIAKTIAEAHR